jgi:hypothetical protein
LKRKNRSDGKNFEQSRERAQKVTRARAKGVRSDRIDKATRCVCLAIGIVLFPFGIFFIVQGNQATGMTIIVISIPFMVLARWFKKIRIKTMGLEIDAR